MKSRSHLNKLQLLCLTGLILALIGLMTPALVLALPPRTTPPPTEKKADKGKEKDRPIGAYIELQAAALPPGP
jgi:hypothetical protein